MMEGFPSPPLKFNMDTVSVMEDAGDVSPVKYALICFQLEGMYILYMSLYIYIYNVCVCQMSIKVRGSAV